MTGGVLAVAPACSVGGTLRVPGDKSISHRYAILAGIADGTTTITGLSPGADLAATLDCLSALGVRIERRPDGAVRITGTDRQRLASPGTPLDARNSGTTLRLLAGVLAGCPTTVGLTGDASLRRRPMRRIIDPLTAMGATIASAGGYPPLTVAGGRLRPLRWRSPVASAQVKSAVLLAGLCAEGRTTVDEPAATRDHTERAFPVFGIPCETDGLAVSVHGVLRPTAPSATLDVPGDPSSAAVWACAAAALPGSAVTIEDVCLNPRRLGFVRALEGMGATVTITPGEEVAGEPRGSLRLAYGHPRATRIDPADVPDLIDELPVLAAAAALGGRLEVSGASELRVKESDRITALVAGLRALGVAAEERPDGFLVSGDRRPRGGTADAAGDHRLVMAFAIVGLGAAGPTTITGADAVTVSYPGFASALEALRT
ncbi:MAG TPA: 3-phosphoshikimate 1-carboxyvinyltransferase [Vicinamibacterales bacterium]|nr:3-phosphoshikimate 1-carboxyvinyltransferase [Vicinamibacterales bacterium]